jgi:chromosomal replication initiation ATPase DnaA
MDEKIKLWLSATCSYFDIDMETLLGRSDRSTYVADARKTAMYILYYKVGLTYQHIGKLFDNRNRSGVQKSINNIDIGYIKAVERLAKTKNQKELKL